MYVVEPPYNPSTIINHGMNVCALPWPRLQVATARGGQIGPAMALAFSEQHGERHN
jgi:hypothetical protein